MALTSNYGAPDAGSLEELSALLRELAQSRCVNDSDGRLLDFGHRFGFRSEVYLVAPRNPQRAPHLKWIAGTFDGFWSTYLAGRMFQFDPVLRAARAQRIGIEWSDVALTAKPASRAELFFRCAGLHGISNGLTVPIRRLHGRLTVACLVGQPPPLAASTRQMLMLAAAFARQNKVRTRHRPARLTDRQAEICHWIALGKSDWDISQILAVSARTVNFHIENIKRKYGVTTLIQAIVAGLRDGAFEA